jgi:protein-disulfide isomerase
MLVCVLVGLVSFGALAQAEHSEITYEELPRLGSADAPVKIVEFADFKCPHCKTFAGQIVPLMRNEFIRAGIAALYFAHFPVVASDSVTAGAAAAAVYDLYGNEAFWEYEKALFDNQGPMREEWATPEFLASLAASVVDGADEAEVLEAIESGEYIDVVRSNSRLGEELGVRATPTVVVGDTVVRDSGNYQRIRQVIESKR